MTEAIAYWVFGIVLGGALVVQVGKPIVAERGKKALPALTAAGALLGVLLGWAINEYVAYVRASATLHP